MTTTRRTFLKVLGATGAVSACGIPILACGTPPPGDGGDPLPSDGLTADKVPDGLSFLDGQQVILGKDSGGIYAMTSICTHLACDITVSGKINGNEIDCLCHGSKYDANGNVTFGAGGPSQSPLAHFDVAIGADKTVTVDTSKTVDASTRAAV